MRTAAFLMTFSFFMGSFLYCTDPANPWEDPTNVEVTLFLSDSTLVNHPDSTFTVGETITLGLTARIINLIDSCFVSIGSDTSFPVIFANVAEGDTLWYSYTFSVFGSKLIRLHVDIKDGYFINDSLTVTVLGKAVSILTHPAGDTVMAGDSVFLGTTVEGSDTITYQWYKDTIAVSGKVQSSFSIPNVTLADSGKYYCIADNQWGQPDTTDPAYIKVSLLTYSLTISAGSNGKVHPDTTISVFPDFATAITAVPDSGFYLSKWNVISGSALIADSIAESTTVVLSSGDAHVQAHFSNQASLTLTKQGEGTVSPSNTVIASWGDSITITAAPSAGYYFREWHVESGSASFTDSTMKTALISKVVLGSGAVVMKAVFTDTALCTLAVSAGPFTEPFDPKKETFAITVPDSVTSLTVTPTANHTNAIIAVQGTTVLSGNESHPVALVTGVNNIAVTVVSSDSVTTNSYYILATRLPSSNAKLDSLTPSAGILVPAFQPDTLNYSVGVPFDDSVFTLTAVTQHQLATAAFLPTMPITLSMGDTVVTVTVTAHDGTTTLAYTIKVRRLNNVSTLDTLYCSGGLLSPQFTSGNMSYMVKVPKDTATVSITATVTDTNASMVQNIPNPITLSADTTVVTVTVLSEDNLDTSVYEVSVIWKPYTFSKTFGAGNIEAGIQLYDGYYYCGGDIGGKGVILKLNPNGTEAKRIEPAGVSNINDMVLTPDSAFIACGSNTSKDGWLAKIDVDLNTIGNVLTQVTANEDRFETIAAKHNNAGFIGAGEFNWDRTWNTGDSWFVTIDPNAVYVGHTNHGGPARDYVLDITQAPGGGYLFVGSFFPTAQDDGLAWLGKVDETGSTLQINKKYSAPNGMSFAGVIPFSAGGSLCVGSKMVEASPTSWRPDGLVMRCNDAGDSLWAEQYGVSTATEYLQDIVPAHDGGYLCAGTNDGKGWLLKIDDNGNKVWEKTHDTGNLLWSISKTSHKGYICCGRAGTDAWVLRVNEKGELDP